FGGITRCDEAARGIISAVKKIDPGLVPVVRLGGTNEAEGWSILKDSGLEIEVCKNMKEAVIKAIEYGEEV
ncbi:MAG: succinate--CoA ligase subunit beta, partial [Candidatus Syntrophonatronum acetioxidans]